MCFRQILSHLLAFLVHSLNDESSLTYGPSNPYIPVYPVETLAIGAPPSVLTLDAPTPILTVDPPPRILTIDAPPLVLTTDPPPPAPAAPQKDASEKVVAFLKETGLEKVLEVLVVVLEIAKEDPLTLTYRVVLFLWGTGGRPLVTVTTYGTTRLNVWFKLSVLTLEAMYSGSIDLLLETKTCLKKLSELVPLVFSTLYQNVRDDFATPGRNLGLHLYKVFRDDYATPGLNLGHYWWIRFISRYIPLLTFMWQSVKMLWETMKLFAMCLQMMMIAWILLRGPEGKVEDLRRLKAGMKTISKQILHCIGMTVFWILFLSFLIIYPHYLWLVKLPFERFCRAVEKFLDFLPRYSRFLRKLVYESINFCILVILLTAICSVAYGWALSTLLVEWIPDAAHQQITEWPQYWENAIQSNCDD